MLRVGIVGQPNAGKSTLFNAPIGRRQADVAAYPFSTIAPNIGVIKVHADRLEEACLLFESARDAERDRNSPTWLAWWPAPARAKARHPFLGHIRSSTRPRTSCAASTLGRASRRGHRRPVRRAQDAETELPLADLRTIERRRERTAPLAHGGEIVRRPAGESGRLP